MRQVCWSIGISIEILAFQFVSNFEVWLKHQEFRTAWRKLQWKWLHTWSLLASLPCWQRWWTIYYIIHQISCMVTTKKLKKLCHDWISSYRLKSGWYHLHDTICMYGCNIWLSHLRQFSAWILRYLRYLPYHLHWLWSGILLLCYFRLIAILRSESVRYMY